VPLQAKLLRLYPYLIPPNVFHSCSDRLTCLQPESGLQYTDSNIFKARWKPLRAAIQQKLTQDAEKLSKCKRNDDELSTKWVSSFQAASGGGGHDGEIEPLPSIGFEQPESKKETEEEKLRRKSSYFI
jgi:hypothetical protein